MRDNARRARSLDQRYQSRAVAMRPKFSVVLTPGGRPRRGEARPGRIIPHSPPRRARSLARCLSVASRGHAPQVLGRVSARRAFRKSNARRARSLTRRYPVASRGHPPLVIRRINARRAAPKGRGAPLAPSNPSLSAPAREITLSLCVRQSPPQSSVLEITPSP